MIDEPLHILRLHIFTGISKEYLVEILYLSLTESDWEYRNNAVWDTD